MPPPPALNKFKTHPIQFTKVPITTQPKYCQSIKLRERSSITSARLGGVGGLSRNADTADAGEGGRGVSDKMLTLLTLGSEGVEKSWVRAEIKRKLYK